MIAADGPLVRAPAWRALIVAAFATLVLLPGCGKDEKKDVKKEEKVFKDRVLDTAVEYLKKQIN